VIFKISGYFHRSIKKVNPKQITNENHQRTLLILTAFEKYLSRKAVLLNQSAGTLVVNLEKCVDYFVVGYDIMTVIRLSTYLKYFAPHS
jgi:hypothetical protein